MPVKGESYAGGIGILVRFTFIAQPYNFEYFYGVLKAFQKHIADNFKSLKAQRFLLACSGGVDSVVLAHLCNVSKLSFSLAHCNFGLRGKESDEDETFVGALAKKLNVPFFVTHFDTVGYVHDHKVSIQMAARDLRYAWFSKIMKERDIEILVTAHHAGDNIETFIINLARGTGIDGLLGIPDRTEALARPLLPFTRIQILEYAKAKGIVWREDVSNKDTKYTRNRIRHEIVPVIEQLHPTFQENFKNTQEYLRGTAELVKNHIEELKATLFDKQDAVTYIKITDLLKLKPREAYVYWLFKSYGFTAWKDITHLLTTISGKEIRSKTHRLVTHGSYLLLTPLVALDTTVYTIEQRQTKVSKPLSITIVDVEHIGTRDKHVLYVDESKLKYPLYVRNWKKGDYFYPFGMRGKKKLSKFFKDEKMDKIERERQWLLCSGDNIVWVIGKRSDERYKVTDTTSKIKKFISTS